MIQKWRIVIIKYVLQYTLPKWTFVERILQSVFDDNNTAFLGQIGDQEIAVETWMCVRPKVHGAQD